MRLVLLLTSLWSPPTFAGEVVDRVVVVVGDELVLASEVQLEGELAWLDQSAVPFWDPSHEDPLHRLVDAAVIRASAGELDLYDPDEDDVRARMERLRLQFADRASWETFLARWGIDEPALQAQLRRRMIVERFLLRNLHLATDPPDPWLQATEELLDQLRPRYRIREIPRRSGP